MTAGPFARFLEARGFAVLDGGLATALAAAGHALDTPLWSARAVLEAPDAVRAVHRAYLEAGADCITTAGYQASFEGFLAAGLDRAEAAAALRRSVELAIEAKDEFWAVAANREGRREPIVAASAGPYGAFLADGSEYDGRYGVGSEALERFHRARLEVLADTAADIVALETVPSGLEAGVLAGLLAEEGGKPAWISFTCRDGDALRDGTPIGRAVRACAAADRVVAVGVNCVHPSHVRRLIDQMVAITDLAIVVYPNSGERYDTDRGAWVGPSASWLDEVAGWIEAGARIVGGCCRVGPDDIRRLESRLAALPEDDFIEVHERGRRRARGG